MEKNENIKYLEEYSNLFEKIPGIKNFNVDDFDNYGVNIFINLEENNKYISRKEKMFIVTMIKKLFVKLLGKTVSLVYNKDSNDYEIDFRFYNAEPNKSLMSEINTGKIDLIKEIRKEIWLSKILKTLDYKGKIKKRIRPILEQYFYKNYKENLSDIPKEKFISNFASSNNELLETEQIDKFIKSNIDNYQEETKEQKDNEVYMVTPGKKYYLIPDKFKNKEVYEKILKLGKDSEDLIEHLEKIKYAYPNKIVDVYYFYIHHGTSVITEKEKNDLGYYGRFDTTPIIIVGDNEEAIEKAIIELEEYQEEEYHISEDGAYSL